MPSLVPRAVRAAYLATVGVAVLLFTAAAALLATTLPYHEWDSFAFGEWSRHLAGGGSPDPFTAGQSGAGRPLFYALQGWLWEVTGVSFSAGRLLSLAFVLVLLAALAAAAWTLPWDREFRQARACVVVLFMLSVPSLAVEALGGKSDVPAAAMVALAVALALRRRETIAAAAALGVVSFLAVLAKPTVIPPLVGLGIWLLLEKRMPLRRRLHWSAGPVAAGLALGLLCDLVMALRFHTGLVEFLRTGTGGIWAQRAAAARWDAVLRLDVFGAPLRLPLAFALVYFCVRTAAPWSAGRTALVAWAGALVWSIVGPAAAGVPGGAFADAYDGFFLIAFAVILTGVALAGDEVVPRRDVVLLLGLTGVPPLLLWFASAAYADRLASTAWPGLILLMGACTWAGIRGLARSSIVLALAPLPILALACWLALTSLDGLHSDQWAEYRSLGWNGVRDRGRAMHVVLPTMRSTILAAEPYLTGSSRLLVSDPRFSWFVPAEVTTAIALRCEDLAGFTTFILLTSDESQYLARSSGGLATPEEWARCTSPPLEQLSDGSNGYAVFVVRG